MKNLRLAICAIVAVSLAACGGEKPSTANESESTIETIEKEQVKKELENFVYPIPTPFKLTQMLSDIDAAFILSLTNSVENASKYITEGSKAVNLGIYGTDLSYASTYNQKQVVIDYINTTNKLIDELNFSQAADKDMPSKVEKYEDNKDSLVNLLTNSFYKTYSFLNENGRKEIAYLILAGTWIEGVYIATHISESTYSNVEIVKIIMEQKQPLNRLVEILSNDKDIASVAEMLAELSKIKTVYDGMEEGSISEKQIADVTEQIEQIREKYTEVQ